MSEISVPGDAPAGCACPGRAEGRHGMLCEHVLRGAFGSVADAPADVKQLLRDDNRLVAGVVIEEPPGVDAGQVDRDAQR